MPADVPPIADEREGLLGFLAQQRDAIRIAAYGLTQEQARATPTASALSVGGIVKHVASVEKGWVDLIEPREPGPEGDDDGGFTFESDDTLDELLARYADVARHTELVIAAIDDLGRPVPVPDAPWYPKDLKAWSVRWVLFHLIEETARHAGHADIIRESIDGAQFHPLMAAVEGWPANEWIQPWKPPAS